MPIERTRLYLLSQKTLIVLSDMPVAKRSPVSLKVTQLTERFEFKRLMEPIEGNCWGLSESLT